MKPGVYPGLAMAEYLKLPAVSASLLGDILERCPRAAWHNSWLNPHRELDLGSATQNAGTIAHAILLEGTTAGVAVIDPNDHPTEKTNNIPDGWTNKSIRLARDIAIGNGKIPVLAPQMIVIEAMVAAARAFIESLKPQRPEIWELFQPGGGDSELTIVWDDDGTACRIRPDRISKNRRFVVDYKTGGTSAEPDAWGRTQLIRMGYYVDAAFYRRGVHAAFDTECEYLFLVQEQDPPHLCSLIGIEPQGVKLGDRKIARGLMAWAQCAKLNHWPAYPADICYPQIPAWEFTRWEERDGEQIGIPYDPAKLWGPRQAREDDPAVA